MLPRRAGRSDAGGRRRIPDGYAGLFRALLYVAFHAGLGDQKIVTTRCPGGKERMRRLLAMIEHTRVDLSSLVTHAFALDDIHEAFDLVSHQKDGVLKVALDPDAARARKGRELVAAVAGDGRRIQ